MFVCEPCHKKICPGFHVMVSFCHCELCRLEAECFDCVTTHPATKEEIEAFDIGMSRWRGREVAAYRNVAQIQYPREST